MQVGSIVEMVIAIPPDDIAFIVQFGITRFPTPKEGPYVVSELEPDSDGQFEMLIQLEEYPEMIGKLFMDAAMFRELLPPGNVDIEELISAPEEMVLEAARLGGLIYE